MTVKEFAAEQLAKAKVYARRIKIANSVQRKSLTANHRDEIRASIADDPEFVSLNMGDGIGAWASIAAIDLRSSTKLADHHHPRETYLMTHTLLPTLAFVCEHSEGSVMNFRGDGLFASFGLKKLTDDDDEFPSETEQHNANRDAVSCGCALIEATCDAVQPVLEDEGIDLDLAVGVGVDCGPVVVTRVGWMSANELTAYGQAVNTACKLSDGVNRVKTSPRVKAKYPSGPGGKMQFVDVGDGFLADITVSMLD
ncbi:adenylate/guanylate cyclase domain-containing protein [Roseiconus lacunae]|nr:adenylate/guanylate cyclase domain-containing protein [Roseiconus lacunae]